jgi:hexosaminidase
VDGYPKLEEIASKRTLLNYTDGRTYGGFYSRKDIREVVSYAGQRMVTVVPEMECPGHASALLAAYPEMGCAGGPYHVRDQWGIFPEVMCPGKQKVFDFLAAAIKSLSELFPSPYIHIGGDECPHSAWEQCPDCQKIMKENGFKTSDALQGWFTGKVAALVHQAGKTCIGWDEVFEFARKGDLPDDFIVMSWRGEKGGREALKAGYRVIMSPNTEGLYLDYKHVDAEVEPGNLGVSTIKEIAAYDPVKGMDEQEKQRVLGAQGNLWTEKVTSGRLAEYMLYPRLAVLAERLWSGKSENLEERLSSEYKKLEKMDIACYRGRIE